MARRWRKAFDTFNSLITLAGMAALVFLLSCSRHQPQPEKRTNLLVITIDTLRADRLGCYGYSQVETPRIDRLAKDGVLFTRAFTPVPITLPSHVSIFTGLYPPSHGVRNNGTFTLDQSATTLAEVLQQQGYRTAAIVSSYTLDSCFGLNQGFEFYDDDCSQNQSGGPSILHNERIGENTSQRALQWLDEHHQERFFLWLHYFDPHADYSPPEPFRSRYQKNPYDGEIAYTDQCLGRVLDKLEQLDLLDNTLVVFTADHGEGLGEHKERTHAFFIYDSTLRVPLIFRYPARLSRGLKVTSLVRTIDLVPTILDVLKVSAGNTSSSSPAGLKMQGVSLYPAMAADRDRKPLNRDMDLYCESLYPRLNHHLSPLFGLRTQDWKYIQAPKPELYQLRQDAGEINNLLANQPDQATKLEARLLEMRKSIAALQAGSDAQTALSSEQRQRLQSLGYVWSENPAPEGESLPDPKDFILVADQADAGFSCYSKGQFIEAVKAFQQVLKANPKDISTHFMLGLVYEKQQKTDLALQEYQEAIRLDPAYLDAHRQLGTLFAAQGELDRALAEFQEALRLNPDHKEVLNLLGGVYLFRQQFDEARTEIQKALALDPNFADAHYNLGLLFSRTRAFDLAIAEFQTALRIKPAYQTISSELGDIYLMTGKPAQAVTELQKAVQLQPDQVKPRIHLGIAYYSLNQEDQAIMEIEKALTLDPNNPEAFFHLGVAYGQKGQTDKALDAYQKALKARPDYADAYMNIGTIYFHQQALDQAIAVYQKAVKIAPGYAQAHFNLATAYDTKGMIDQAIKEYQETLRLQPDFVMAAQLLERARQMQQGGLEQ
ncbi:MAG: tetratricopeptide repeat protein [bacterium]